MNRRNLHAKKDAEYNLKKLNIKEFSKKIIEKEHNDENECPICLNTNETIVNLDCSHKMCERCICRLNVLIKTKQCPVCKQESINCTNKTYMKHKCMLCTHEAKSLVSLIHHYKSHKIILCEECIMHKNEFSDEFVLYSIDEIQTHKRKGTTEEKKNGFYGHIFCHFCKKYFYDADECKKHCRKAHFLCTVCETVENRHQYYNNNADLNLHLREMHYVCDFSECNGISFAHQIGLTEHMLKTHKIGTGTVSLKKEIKIGTVPVMAPYDEESRNAIKTVNVKEKQKNKLAAMQNTSRTVPIGLDRSIFRQELQPDTLLAEGLKRKYPANHQEFLKASNMYTSHDLSAELFLEKIEMLIGGKETIKFADDIMRYYNADDKRVLKEYLKVYKMQVLFPKFVKSDKQEVIRKKDIKSYGFKIIEIKKGKK